MPVHLFSPNRHLPTATTAGINECVPNRESTPNFNSTSSKGLCYPLFPAPHFLPLLPSFSNRGASSTRLGDTTPLVVATESSQALSTRRPFSIHYPHIESQQSLHSTLPTIPSCAYRPALRLCCSTNLPRSSYTSCSRWHKSTWWTVRQSF